MSRKTKGFFAGLGVLIAILAFGYLALNWWTETKHDKPAYEWIQELNDEEVKQDEVTDDLIEDETTEDEVTEEETPVEDENQAEPSNDDTTEQTN